jgi:phage tail-like protein
MRRDALERLLPTMYQLAARPGSPLDAALWAMEDLHAPDEALLDDIDAVFDPYRCPDAFVPWLTRWVGLEWLVDEGDDAGPGWDDPADAFPPGLHRLRELVALGGTLAQWRGTEAGLALFLRAATGVEGWSITEPPDQPFHLVVEAPASAAPWAPVVRRIVEAVKPACSTAEVRFPGPAAEPEPEPAPEGAA